jgi:TonB family protein
MLAFREEREKTSATPLRNADSGGNVTSIRLGITHILLLAIAINFPLAGTALPTQDDPPRKASEIVYEGTGKGMTHPNLVYHPNPEYSGKARLKKVQGTVGISMIVTAEGTVRDPVVTTSLDKDLDKKALECVSKWRLDPATKDGQPVAMRISVQVNFHLY